MNTVNDPARMALAAYASANQAKTGTPDPYQIKMAEALEYLALAVKAMADRSR